MSFSLYFLASVPEEEKTPEPGSVEAHRYLWNFPGTTLDVSLVLPDVRRPMKMELGQNPKLNLTNNGSVVGEHQRSIVVSRTEELTHNYGTEKEEGPKYHPGNLPQEGDRRDGFGHVAFSVHDVEETCNELDTAGVKFQKKPNEGRMKGLAFALDPDGYWVEIIRGGQKGRHTLAQTMLRIKDPKKSLEFYTKHLGMTLLSHRDFPDAKFSLYFLGTMPEGATEFPSDRPVLELTHNHGTENDEKFQYYSGNEADRKGFGHLGFLVDDVYETCKELEEAGYAMQKAPDGGSMKGLAFARDPDGYWVEIIKRGGYDEAATPYFFEK